jgi:NAD(P)-dependent dehydrogenase (short-subunit alcohol dehydrogenase family)
VNPPSIRGVSTVNDGPMKRLGEPREVGELAVFLCSDRAGYITDANMSIDGALTSIPAGLTDSPIVVG